MMEFNQRQVNTRLAVWLAIMVLVLGTIATWISTRSDVFSAPRVTRELPADRVVQPDSIVPLTSPDPMYGVN